MLLGGALPLRWQPESRVFGRFRAGPIKDSGLRVGPGVAIGRFRDKTNPRRLVKLPSVASGFLFPNRNCGLDFFCRSDRHRRAGPIKDSGFRIGEKYGRCAPYFSTARNDGLRVGNLGARLTRHPRSVLSGGCGRSGGWAAGVAAELIGRFFSPPQSAHMHLLASSFDFESADFFEVQFGIVAGLADGVGAD